MINYFPYHRMSELVNLVINSATVVGTKVASNVQWVREAWFIVMRLLLVPDIVWKGTDINWLAWCRF